jgi:4-diphosphocytidyl-2-C-methyl-D-erythritol kinase
MLIQHFSRTEGIDVLAPAKLNLVLEVLGKRSDGYHQVSTVMCPITLWDRLIVTPRSSPSISLELELPAGATGDDPAWRIPTDGSNLVVRAAQKVQHALKVQSGCHIRLTKQIPAAAGLGGGSSNAAATIVACMLLWTGWDRRLANTICHQLGSDTNFFLGDFKGIGMMLAQGRGEQTSLIPYRPKLAFFLTHPPMGCSTKEVYARLGQVGNLQKSQDFLAACESGQDSKIGATMFNALQSWASAMNPWIAVQLNLLSEIGCQHGQMSGSGSSCFAIAAQPGRRPESQGEFERLARERGITRAYRVEAWYGESIEQQIDARS